MLKMVNGFEESDCGDTHTALRLNEWVGGNCEDTITAFWVMILQKKAADLQI